VLLAAFLLQLLASLLKLRGLLLEFLIAFLLLGNSLLNYLLSARLHTNQILLGLFKLVFGLHEHLIQALTRVFLLVILCCFSI